MNRKEFQHIVSTTLRKTFTSTIALSIKPRPVPDQYKELTIACNAALGTTKFRRDVDNATLRQIAVLEGLLSIEIRKRHARSMESILELIPEIAVKTLSLGAEGQKQALRGILEHFKISKNYKTVTTN